MQAIRDENGVTALTAASEADGMTPVRVTVNPSTHALSTSDGTGGADLSGDVASRDQNGVPVLMGVSSADGVTPVAIYANADGELLTQST